MTLYLDLSVIQTVPSANINRDEVGAPKKAYYGGVLRSRVSSQAWKHAIREDFAKANVDTAYRTKLVPKKLAKLLQAKNGDLSDEEAMELSVATLTKAKISVTKDNELSALMFISKGQLEKLADYVLENKELNEDQLKVILQSNNSADLALFGRMVASDPTLSVDASVQVAHTISTHEIVPEFDYYTALDDLKTSAGAAMVGTTEYNSATLFRYANINLDELLHNLGDKNITLDSATQFIKSFISSMPTGYQNAFANKTIPEYVMLTLRNDTPVNLVSAFEEPVQSTSGFSRKSVEQLEKEYKNTLKFLDEPVANFVLSKYDSSLEEQVNNLADLLDKVKDSFVKLV
ncbi:type I-E CRISPR-associated protein Cas7/Cse4/CasC [Ligilactobacillus equi]|uniref:Crispr-associated protein n=1 Tax=Ligilactobacillus equi DSM 15833 = JCM 10991 TaxID=1423740 RepID=A0A0R1TH76_9LACO|nr:type I-E CRISPR-associated protein Cas7/Cse4/CasC [Ligilactobacillus equi]KRL78242.1 crispr-associated protein [Ligilactobacillus equi DSM 15833 = JCM 10991]